MEAQSFDAFIYVENDKSNIYDFGLLYNSNEVKVKEIEFDSHFSNILAQHEGVKAYQDQTGYDYVAFEAAAKSSFHYSGCIGKVTFDRAQSVNTLLSLCRDSMYYYKQLVDSNGNSPFRLRDAAPTEVNSRSSDYVCQCRFSSNRKARTDGCTPSNATNKRSSNNTANERSSSNARASKEREYCFRGRGCK